MNINYEQWSALEEGTDPFQYVVDQNVRASELYARAKGLVENSEFKGKLKLSLWIYRNCVWFTVWSTYQPLEVREQYEQNPTPLMELCKVMESHQVDVRNQTIVIYGALGENVSINGLKCQKKNDRGHSDRY